MKNVKKVISILSLLLVIGNAIPANAINNSAWGQDSTYKYYVKTTTTTMKVQPVYASQTEHTSQADTTISITSSYSFSQSASASISVGGTMFVTLSATAGVSQTQTNGVSIGQSYTIKSSQPSGRYRVELCFPGSVTQKTKFLANDENTIAYQGSITFTPDTNASYKRLYKYS